jgi:hypothetical protein
MGGTLFDVARWGIQWTAWRSVIVGLIGLAGLGLGIAYAAWGLAIASGLVFLVGAGWTASSVRSYRDARRLERRASRAESGAERD